MPKGSEGNRLSELELQIISLVVLGLRNKEIASRLAISQDAVRSHQTTPASAEALE